MNMLVNCSGCRTPLQLPQGAQSTRCALCRAVTRIGASAATHAPPNPMTYAPPPPNPHGRKKAVICGISYRFSRHELKGCIKDAKCMRYLLVNRFKFPSVSIIMLTEEETDPYKIPTKHNLRMALFWLVQGCQPGDSLVFHFSGHGSQQRNYNGDEVDGYDETLCPLDFETKGMIVDDEINAAIVRSLPRGVKLHAIIDACHSGTVLDLPFLCRMNRFVAVYIACKERTVCLGGPSPSIGNVERNKRGEVISFSGCDDNQTSTDTPALSKITSTGAMTFCFIQAIERGNASTYASILTLMRSAIQNAGGGASGGSIGLGSLGGGAVTSLLGMLLSGGSGGLGGRLKQKPQLTACEPFDVYAKPFSL